MVIAVMAKEEKRLSRNVNSKVSSNGNSSGKAMDKLRVAATAETTAMITTPLEQNSNINKNFAKIYFLVSMECFISTYPVNFKHCSPLSKVRTAHNLIESQKTNVKQNFIHNIATKNIIKKQR